ncbi:MAG TPA: type I restriction endonuclease subunit M [Usitatibacter sp.]|jgi:hypothetical protein|nr:type I restriction endonuclease subunit M [Usitatibacter sp.]
MNAQLHQHVLFVLGRIVATPGALALLDRAQESGLDYVLRHVTGDFGEVCEEDAAANREAITNGTRILSAYRVQGERLWIITETDRSLTALLLPEEY